MFTLSETVKWLIGECSIISASEIDEKERERDTIGEKIAFLDYFIDELRTPAERLQELFR